MKRLFFILFLFVSFCSLGQSLFQSNRDTLLMGSMFIFTAVGESNEEVESSINNAIEEVVRIEKLISSWDHNSQTHLINMNAGIKPVKVDKELFDLINRSLKVSRLTDGVFDISFASIDYVWDFKVHYETIPDSGLIDRSVEKINYENIVLNSENQSVFLREKGMKIGFGAIGKGYAANRAKQVMIDYGSFSGVVNAGGDIICWGNKANGEKWTVGIADPFEKNSIKLWLDVSDLSVVTSGDYERFVMIDGMRYGHIINPKTGWPTKGIRSVTIISSDAEIGDALATSVFVLGTTKGLALINKLDGLECLIIDDKNEMHLSNNLDPYLVHFKK